MGSRELVMLVQGAAGWSITSAAGWELGGVCVIQISVRISNERSVHFVIYTQPAVFATLS